MTSMSSDPTTLFSPVRVGAIECANRIFMAPLTRCRATPGTDAANALIADLVPSELRGTAYGTYNAVIGLLAFPASVIAGVLWQGLGTWNGFGPSAPFVFGGLMALIAAGLMAVWLPKVRAAQ